jgi:hypothetical protein
MGNYLGMETSRRRRVKIKCEEENMIKTLHTHV